MVTVAPMPPSPQAYSNGAPGLGPDGILRHATEYGAWCQTNAAKLRALEAFFWTKDEK